MDQCARSQTFQQQMEMHQWHSSDLDEMAETRWEEDRKISD